MTLGASARWSTGIRRMIERRPPFEMCLSNALHRTAATRGTRWNQSGCEADEYQYSCVLQFRGVQTQKISPQSHLTEFSHRRGGQRSCARLCLDGLRQYFRSQPLSATRQHQFRCTCGGKARKCCGPQRAARLPAHRSARTAAFDFRAGNRSCGAIAFIR